MNEISSPDADLDAAVAHHEAGRLSQAEVIYRAVLSGEPDHPEALNLLGVLLQDIGNLTDSILTLTRATTVDPGYPEAFTNLARGQNAIGDAEGAKQSSLRAMELDPELAAAHLQHARASLSLNENQAAATAAALALKLAPDLADAAFCLGHSLARLNDHAAAAVAYRTADQLAPDQYTTLINLGLVLSELKQHEEATAYCHRALALAPDVAQVHAITGLVLRRADDILGSIQATRNALALAPDQPDLWLRQGNNLSLLGRFAEAADCYRQVLSLDSQSAGALSGLAAIGELGRGGEATTPLQAVLDDPNRPVNDRAAAGFALGKVLDSQSDFDGAFRAYAGANRLMRETIAAGRSAFNRDALRSQIDHIRRAFVPDTFKATAGWGDPSDVPVFIVGMPRSGTTLIEQILASHPSVFCAGERRDLGDIAARLDAGKTALVPAAWSSASVRQEAEAHLRRLRAVAGSARRVIDKLPDNILLLGHIAVLYPNARVIFSRRDPRDVCLSCFFQLFQDDLPWSYDLADCAARAAEIERLTAHWRANLPLRILELDYEALVENQECESRRLIDFLGLEWNDSCLDFQAADRVVHTASFWQVKQPLHARSVGRWRHYQRHIQPLLDGLTGISVTSLLDQARSYRSTGHFVESAEAAAAAAALNPDEASAHFLLGAARLDMGDAAGAQPVLERAIEFAPNSYDARMFYAMACMRLKQLATAAAALREALRIKPDDAECLAKLGRLQGELGQFDEALDMVRRATEHAPLDGLVHLSLVTVLWLRGEVPAAAAAAETALRFAPNLAELWLHAGYCHSALGRFSDAETSYRNALAIDPELGAAHFALARIGLGADAQQDLARLERMLTDEQRNRAERIAAGHALGELLDRAGDYDGAWSAYDAANRLATLGHQTTVNAFDPVAFDTHIEKLIETFSAAFFESHPETGNPSAAPVFVVGMPRSGTTLVEQIACSHPDVFGAGELSDIRAIVERLAAGSANLLGVQADEIAAESSKYISKIRELSGNAERVIDKMPDNFQWLGHIATLFPNTRVIVCRRDYRDVALSCLFQTFGDNLPWSTDVVDIAARIRGFDRLMTHWRQVLPVPVLEVQYEDLVNDLEAGSRRLIEFLGLPWDPACLAFHRTERAVMTASSWQVRQPLYTSSVSRWRNYRRHLGLLLAGLAGLVESDGSEDWDGLAANPVKALAVAIPQHRAGQLTYPEAIYRALLRRDPKDATALHLLGLLKVDRGEPSDAIALLSQSLALRPANSAAMADLARAHCATGDAAAAIDAANRALSLDPDLAEGWLYLGCAMLMRQEVTEAVAALRRASKIAPHSAGIWMTLAKALTDHRNFPEAVKAWEAASTLRPNDPSVLRGHASALAEMKRYAEALTVFRQVDALAPGQAAVLYGMAGALMHTGDVHGALEMCQRGLETIQDARFWLLLANCQATLGRFAAAADACRKALELDPGMTGALRDLVALGARADDEAAEQIARATLEDPARPARDRAGAGFALGQLKDRHAAYEEAFAAYTHANRLLRQERNAHGFRFDRNGFRNFVTTQIAAFDRNTFLFTSGWGNSSEVPVFIVGMPRSGTSLVEQILASHHQVFGAGELTDVFAILGALDNKNAHSPPVTWDPAAVRSRASAHLDKLRTLGGGAPRVTDKQPDNILCLGQIAVLFPRARIIVCRRDPRDVCLSCYFQLFRDDPLVWTDDLEDCAFRAAEVERLMRHWREVVPNPMLEINYEALVGDLEGQSRRLTDFLGLDWDPACLDFHLTERAVMTASHWQVRQPLYSGSAGRWRNYGKYLAPAMRHLDGLIPAEDS